MMDSLNFRSDFKDDYIFLMTDDTGMFQHSYFGVPNPIYGYTTDDNARALIMAVMLYERYHEKKYLDLIYRYSLFLLNAQNKDGKFKNFMSYDRRWLEKEGSEDCLGRCIWALGFALFSDCTPKGVKAALANVLKKALPNVASLEHIRAKAYSIIGLSFIDDSDSKGLVYDMAQSLCTQYDEHKDGEWKWFEDDVTYCNSVLPRSLFSAYRITGDKEFLRVAEESLEFLENITFKHGYFKPVGCNGWLHKGKKPAEYDQQPVEACGTVLTYLEGYKATGNENYKDKAKKCHAWYEGENSKGLSLIDADTGGCYDGLKDKGINLDMGAESLISYVVSFLKMCSIKV
jgi:hypothetical protein